MRPVVAHVLAATLGLSGLAVSGCAHKSATTTTTTTTMTTTTTPAPATETTQAAPATTQTTLVVPSTVDRVDVVGTRIIPKEKIQFDVNKAVVLHGSDDELEDIVTVLKDNPQVSLEIAGHTSSDGAADFNKKLSQERADAVKAWLVSHGIAAARLTAKGHGSEKPIADDKTEEGREKNRRVDFTVTTSEASK